MDTDSLIPADPGIERYSFGIIDGEVYYRETSMMAKPDLSATATARVKGMVELRDCVHRLIDLQMEDADEISVQKERQAHQTPHGRQTVRQLMKQGEATNSLPVEAPREFDRVARRWNVDYAFYKNGEGKYLLFFKSKQADAITACFGEYSRRVMARPRARQVPILERMKRAGELLRQRPQKERAKEAEREER